MPLAREQRKLAAIVAADVVGYSRLMGRDESGTLARLRKNRSEHLDPALAKYGGRLVKLTGDGALVEFSRPWRGQRRPGSRYRSRVPHGPAPRRPDRRW
jgi:class 3 adenylate cyclase